MIALKVLDRIAALVVCILLISFKFAYDRYKAVKR